MTHSLLILGGGNMGGAIARALRNSHEFSVQVTEKERERRLALTAEGISVHATLERVTGSDILLLAIKPQQFSIYARELANILNGATPLLISIMAGIPLAALQAISPRAVRAMPNLPATIRESMSVLCAPGIDAEGRAAAESVFRAIGKTAWVEEEDQLHAVTAISGSGPAYLFAFMEVMEWSATREGLPKALATQLVKQTILGAAKLADQSPESIKTLREQVTSKGGTTEAALQVLAMEDALQVMMVQAIAAAVERSRELAKDS